MQHETNQRPDATLAALEDLREFCLDYTRKDKKFNKELTVFLNERFIEDEDSAADFIARLLEDAFGEERIILMNLNEDLLVGEGECAGGTLTFGT